MDARYFDQRYEIIRPLGRGASGEVFLARDRQAGCEVAIKHLFPEADVSTEFQSEIDSLARLSHERIVKLLGSGAFQNRPYLIFEYVRGQSLGEFLAGRPPPSAEAIRTLGNVWLQLLGALDHLHASGLVHRDLKPANVFLESVGERDNAIRGDAVLPHDCKAKLIDFGFVRNRDLPADEREVFAGTLGYAAPEQVRSFYLSDERSDLFSFGVLLYQHLTGRLPFNDLNELLGDTPPVAPDRVNSAVPPALSTLTLSLIARNPYARPGSAAETAERLDSAIHPGQLRFSDTPRSITGRNDTLSAEELSTFLATSVRPQTPPSPRLQEHVQIETGGLPSIIPAYVRFLVETKKLARSWGELDLAADEPASTVSLPALGIEDPRDTVTDRQLHLLQAAACFTSHFTAADAAFILALPADEIQAELGALAQSKLLRSHGNAWSFHAGIVAQHMRTVTPEATRRRLNEQIVELKQDTAPPELLAFHLREAGRVEEASRRYLQAAQEKLRSGERSLAVAAAEEAIALPHRMTAAHAGTIADILLAGGRARRAVGLLGEYLRDPSCSEQNPQRLELLLKCGRAELMVGGEAEAAHEHFTQAVEALTTSGSRADLFRAYRGLGAALRALNRLPEAEAAYGRMNELAAQGDDPGERMEVVHVLAILAREKRDPATAEKLFRKAAELAEAAGEKRVLAVFLTNLGNLLKSLGRHEEAVTLLRRTIRLRTDLGDRRGLAITYNSLAQEHVARGDLQAALEAIGQSQALFRDSGDLKGQAISLGNRGIFLGLQGHLEGAIFALKRSAFMAQRQADTRTAVEATLEAAELLLLRDNAAAEADFQQVLQTDGLLPTQSARARMGLAVVAREGALWEKAHELIDQARRLLENEKDPEEQARLCATEAETLLEEGRIAEGLQTAQQTYELLPLHASPFVRSRLARILGEAWCESGPLWADRAERFLNEAEQTAAGINYPYELARTHCAWARYLAYQGEHEASKNQAHEAHRIFADLGAVRDAERATALLSENHR